MMDFSKLFFENFKVDIDETFKDFPILKFESSCFEDESDDHWSYQCSFDYNEIHYDFNFMVVLSTSQTFYNLTNEKKEIFSNDSISMIDHLSYVAFLLDIHEMMKEKVME